MHNKLHESLGRVRKLEYQNYMRFECLNKRTFRMAFKINCSRIQHPNGES